MDTRTLVVTDLEGSFWDSELRCHPSTFPALAELEERGVDLLAATGRRAHSARGGLVLNDLWLPAVLLNGALGVDFRSDQQFHCVPFTADEASTIIERLGQSELFPVMYLVDGSVAGPSDVTTGATHRATFGSGFRVVDPVVTAATIDILSFSIIGVPEQQLDPVPAAVPPELATAMVYNDHLYDNQWSVHIQPRNISKLDGIRSYLAYAGLQPDRIIAIGDGSNDVEMLEHADVALGVAGGHTEALDVADVIIPHPTDGGWASVLDHL